VLVVSAADVVVVVSEGVVEGVIEREIVEDVEPVAPIVLELPAVASGGAAEQETTRKATRTANERAKGTIRTGMDRISVPDWPRWSKAMQ
jgi:hypothetical protein